MHNTEGQTPPPLPADHAEVVTLLEQLRNPSATVVTNVDGSYRSTATIMRQAATLIASQAEEIERLKTELHNQSRYADNWFELFNKRCDMLNEQRERTQALQSDIERITKENEELDALNERVNADAVALAKSLEAAESSLASMTAALEPFAAIEIGLDDSADPDETEWFRHDGDCLTVGHFRAARRALSQTTKGTDAARKGGEAGGEAFVTPRGIVVTKEDLAR